MTNGRFSAVVRWQKEVQAFLQRHWVPPAPANGARWPDRWRRGVLDAGWSVPEWSPAAGGAGWADWQLVVWWRLLAQAGVPPADRVALDLVGPLAQRCGQSTVLRSIVDLSVRWGEALTEPGADRDSAAWQCVAQPVSGGYRLQGRKWGVGQALAADRLLLAARLGSGAGFVLLTVDARGPGIQRHPAGPDLVTVTFEDAFVADDGRLGDPDQALELLTAVRDDPRLRQLRALRAAAETLGACDDALGALGPAASEHPADDDGGPDVALLSAGVEALAWRCCGAAEAPTALPRVLTERTRALRLALAEARLARSGAYAHVVQDPDRAHNEGLLGPPGAWTALDDYHRAVAVGPGWLAGEEAATDAMPTGGVSL